MINYIHRKLFRPENGWDPITPAYANNYREKIQASQVENVFVYLDSFVSSMENLNVLDLGGGPGHFSIEFAKRGAKVVWCDVSRIYREIAKKKAQEVGVTLEFFLSYMEEVPLILEREFDLVFNRVCWYYGSSDFAMAEAVTKMVKVGGFLFLETNNSRSGKHSMKKWLQCFLNNIFWLKIGHPYPPKGRVEKLFRRNGFNILDTDYRREGFDRIFAQKIVE